MSRLMLVAVLCATMVGCAAEPPPPTAPLTLDFTRYGAIKLMVGKVDFISDSPLQPAPDAGFFSRFKPSLADAAYRWGQDRMQAIGSQGLAVYSIDKATLTRAPLPFGNPGRGLFQQTEKLFKREQAEKWIAQVTVTLRVANGPERYHGHASATVTRSTTVPENASAREQENAYRRLLLGLMDDLNAQMPQSINTHLNAVTATP